MKTRTAETLWDWAANESHCSRAVCGTTPVRWVFCLCEHRLKWSAFDVPSQGWTNGEVLVQWKLFLKHSFRGSELMLSSWTSIWNANHCLRRCQLSPLRVWLYNHPFQGMYYTWWLSLTSKRQTIILWGRGGGEQNPTPTERDCNVSEINIVAGKGSNLLKAEIWTDKC